LFTAPLPVQAQQAGKAYRIGYLKISGSPAEDPLVPIFEQALRERGWITGKNLLITYRTADGKYDRLPSVAAELVRLDPRVIVAVSTSGTRAAKNATSTIPIVMWGVGDPIGRGLVASFGRPGGNVTGFTDASPDAYAKQLQLLVEAVPHARRIAYLTNPANQAAPVDAVKEAARTLGIELLIVGARGPEDFATAFRAMTQAKVDALLVSDDGVFFRQLGRLADLALRSRLPSMCGNWNYAAVGGLMNYSVDRADTVRKIAGYVDRLLRGAKPADLPVEQPTKFSFVINVKSAKALGLSIPAPLLLQAEQVIE
jgi:putative ABC transport system substrate-binding protein